VADARVWGLLLRASLSGQTAYRFSFAADVVSAGLGAALDFVEVFAIFHQVPALAGLSFPEVLLVFSFATIGFALADSLVGAIEAVTRHIRAGTFDVVLLRPLSVLGQLAVAELQLRRFGRLATALVPLAVVLPRLDVDWTPARVLMLLLAPVVSTVVFGSLFVAAGALTFWLVEGTEVVNALTYGSAYLAEWPTGVLSTVLARFFTFVVPAAFAGYLPALAILGRPDPTGLPGWLPWLAPAVAAAVAGVAALLWRAGIRHYVGAGG
jgi:viologen exporter family transport system permease protein